MKLGDTLSPTLFSIFVNDLVAEINSLDIGISAGNLKVSILLYADDIALLFKSEEDLKRLLDVLHSWCKKWRVLINTDKSKCVHFRQCRTPRTERVFHTGNHDQQTVSTYKYLGVMFHKKGDCSEYCEAFSKGGSHALGNIVGKIHSYKDFGVHAYQKLYDICVIPILGYCASI